MSLTISEPGQSSLDAVRIVPLQSLEMETQWTAFCTGARDTCFYHGLPWRDVLAQEYGFTPLYHVALRGVQVVGLLPLFLVENLTGRKLISLPFSMYGGLYSIDAVTQHKMLAHALQLSREVDAKRVSVRLSPPVFDNGEAFHAHETDSIIEIDGLTYASYEQSLRPRVRTYIRQAIRLGCIVSSGNDDNLLMQFYQLLVLTRQRQRLPAPRMAYLRTIASLYKTHFIVVEHSGRPVSAAMMIEDRNALYFAYHGRIDHSSNGNPTYLVYAEMVRTAVTRQLDAVYLGGSTTASLLDFKRKWNPIHRPIQTFSFPGSPAGPDKGTGIPFWNCIPSRLQGAVSYCVLRYLY